MKFRLILSLFLGAVGGVSIGCSTQPAANQGATKIVKTTEKSAEGITAKKSEDLASSTKEAGPVKLVTVSVPDMT